jgi:hypothetical protein
MKMEKGIEQYQGLVKQVWDENKLHKRVLRSVYQVPTIEELSGKTEKEVLGASLKDIRAVVLTTVPRLQNYFIPGVLLEGDSEQNSALMLLKDTVLEHSSHVSSTDCQTVELKTSENSTAYYFLVTTRFFNKSGRDNDGNLEYLKYFLQETVEFSKLFRDGDFFGFAKQINGIVRLLASQYYHGDLKDFIKYVR